MQITCPERAQRVEGLTNVHCFFQYARPMMDKRTKWMVAFAILLVVFILRAPAFWTHIMDVDEAQFAGYAKALLSGGLPYVASVDTKPIGIYYFYAAVFALFGHNNMIAVHVMTALWVGLTAYFCYRIAKKLYSEQAGFIAALFYAIFSTTYIPKFISTSIVVIMMLPLTISIDLFLSWEQTGRRVFLWLSGIMWGVACLFKYQAGINLILMAFYLLLFRPIILERSIARMNIRAFFIFMAGGALIGGLFALHLYLLGDWNDFVFWSLTGSLAYVEAASSLMSFWKTLAIRGGAIIASSFLLWYFAARRIGHVIADLFRTTRNQIAKHEEYLVVFWFFFSIIPVCTGGKFYGHYFLQLYPALCILAAGHAMSFFAWLKSGAATRLKQWAYALFAIGLFVPALGFFGARLVSDQIYSLIGEENPKVYEPVAQYVKQHTNNKDSIFVWGFATPIYYFSDRIPASRFLWCDWMTGRVSGLPSARDPSVDTTAYITNGSWEMFFADMENRKPIYFIDTSPGNYHDYGKYPLSKYPKLMSYLSDHYNREKSFAGVDFYKRIN